jgi:hypothetical protein
MKQASMDVQPCAITTFPKWPRPTETAGEFAPTLVSIYGNLTPVLDLICRFRTGTTVE